MRIRFDRGTLVLEPEAAGEDPAQFPDATWDEETCAWRYPAYLYTELLGRLADAQVRISDELRIRPLGSAANGAVTGQSPPTWALPNPPTDPPPTWALPDLRWYQTAALAAWDSTRRGVLALPTGSGKTLAALSAIAKLAVTTLILVPTRVLLDQWVQLLEKLSPYPVGRIGDGERKVEGITVATFSSAVIWAPKIGDQFGLVIVDEAHHVGAWCPKEVLEMLPAPYRLGLTATPPGTDVARREPGFTFSDGTRVSTTEQAPASRGEQQPRDRADDHHDDPDEEISLDEDNATESNEHGAPHHSRGQRGSPARHRVIDDPARSDDGLELTRLVGPVVYSLRIDDLVGDGLANYDLVTVPIDLAPDERKAYRENRAKFSSVFAPHQRATHGSSWQDFVRDARRTRAGREALVSWRSYRQLLSYSSGKRSMLRELLALHAGQRTLIFTADVATAYAIAKELLVQPITHEIGKAERADVLARFRSGDISALVSAQVLDEGLDVPDADVAIIVGGSGSARRHVQRIGRVLRPRDGKRARIYELAVNDSTELSYVARRRAGLGERAAEPKRRTSSKRPPASPRDVAGRESLDHNSVATTRTSECDSLATTPIRTHNSVGSERSSGQCRYLPVADLRQDSGRPTPPPPPRPYPQVGELLVAMNMPFPVDGGAR
ncbi:MAG TPA: DEAD/DEAH box helicase family protein [Kofleriaceae bacterium]|jgi:superfamily II DNA or RNA helicase